MTNCNRHIQNDLSNDVQSYFSSEILKVFHNLIVGSSRVILKKKTKQNELFDICSGSNLKYTSWLFLCLKRKLF